MTCARAAILRQSERLLEARSDRRQTLPVDSVPALLGALLDWRFYTPAHAVLDDAVSSGRLNLIRSTEVRRALMAYIQERERIAVFDQLERDFVVSHLEPYLASRIALDRLIGSRTPASATERRRLVRLLGDDVAQLRHDRAETASVFSRIVQNSIEAVRTALDGRPDTSQ